MTHTTRQVNAIKEQIAELFDKLSSFVNLMIMTSVEALFLFLFTTVHEKVHEYFDHSPWCPMKFAVTIMGLSLLLLNVVIVVTFVATEILRTLRTLSSRMNEDGGPVVPPDAGSVDQQQNVTLTAVTNASATITVSVTYALNNDDLLPQLPPSNDREAKTLHG